MANRSIDDNRWVDDRMAALDPDPGWRPDAGKALARLRSRDRAALYRRRGLIGFLAAALVVFALLTVLQAPRACATPLGCASSAWGAIFHQRVTPPPAPAVQPATETPAATPAEVPEKTPAKPNAPEKRSRADRVQNFRETGSPQAHVTCEIYADYSCPACAQLYLNVVPLLMSEYVRTGRVRLVHRDYPLAMHPYSRLAARYANAAGSLGYFDAVTEQLFKTQAVWGLNGNVDGQVAMVLPADVMREVRRLVESDPQLDDSVAADMALGQQDKLTQTPTLAVVAHGKRQVLAGGVSYELLKIYLDQVLAGK